MSGADGPDHAQPLSSMVSGDDAMSGAEQRAERGGEAAAAVLGSPSKKRRKSDSAHAAAAVAAADSSTDDSTPSSAASAASAASSSLTALADATVSLGSAAPLAAGQSGDGSSEQSSVIERMQRQLAQEREAREAAESEARRLERQVQRLEQSSKQQHLQQQQRQLQQPSTPAAPPTPSTPNIASQSAPSTPPHHSFLMSAAVATPASALSLHSSPFITPPPSSQASPLSAGVQLSSGLSELYPPVSVSVPVAEDEGDERGVSCHQCKSNKPKHLLLFCTTKADSSGRKRKCRKKYCQKNPTQQLGTLVTLRSCDACLRRSYQQVINHMSAEDLISWRCPSCQNNCTCAACLRRVGLPPSDASAPPSTSPSATPSEPNSTVTSPTPRKPIALPAASTALGAAAGNGLSLQSSSAPATPAGPPTLLHGYPYPLAMSGMPTSMAVPFAFQPYAFRPTVIAAAAAAAAAAATQPSAASAPLYPSLSVPTSPASSAASGMSGLLPAHLTQLSALQHFAFPLMQPQQQQQQQQLGLSAAPPSSFASPNSAFLSASPSLSFPSPYAQPDPASAAQSRFPLVLHGVRSGLSQLPQSKVHKLAEGAPARAADSQPTAAAG